MAKRNRRSGGARGIRLGYKLSSEEQGPRDLVRLARMAEETGFSFALIHQGGPDQAGFMRFYEREILPRLRTRAAA